MQRGDVSKNLLSVQRVSRNQMDFLASKLNSSGIDYCYFIYDSKNEFLAIHCKNMTSVGQLQQSTSMPWTAYRGKQCNIPFVYDAMKDGLSVERISPFSFCNAKAIDPGTQEHQGPVKFGTKHDSPSQNETTEETKNNWLSKIEELEANQKLLAASLAKANENICFMLTRFPGCARESPVGCRNTTLQGDSNSELENAAGAQVGGALKLAPGFRFASVMEIHARPSLVGMHLVYFWPEMGWLKGKVIRVISRNGFTHVVKYGLSSTWKRGAVVDTLLDIERPEPSRWKLLIPLDKQH